MFKQTIGMNLSGDIFFHLPFEDGVISSDSFIRIIEAGVTLGLLIYRREFGKPTEYCLSDKAAEAAKASKGWDLLEHGGAGPAAYIEILKEAKEKADAEVVRQQMRINSIASIAADRFLKLDKLKAEKDHEHQRLLEAEAEVKMLHEKVGMLESVSNDQSAEIGKQRAEMKKLKGELDAEKDITGTLRVMEQFWKKAAQDIDAESTRCWIEFQSQKFPYSESDFEQRVSRALSNIFKKAGL